jgi:ABC-2 type transport system ATP-binding protein
MISCMGPVIQVRELERRFGARSVLAGVDLAVRPGEIHGVLGPAGAGKTLLLRVLAGQLPPSGGEIRVGGRVELVRAEEHSEFERVSAFENLVFAGRMHGLAPLECVERARALLHESGLAGSCDVPVGAFSLAMLERLALARALMSAPAVLLVDESGADTATVGNLVRLHARRGGAVVWATRRLDSLRGLARDVTLLAGGRVRYTGSVDALALRAMACAEPFRESLAA